MMTRCGPSCLPAFTILKMFEDKNARLVTMLSYEMFQYWMFGKAKRVCGEWGSQGSEAEGFVGKHSTSLYTYEFMPAL